MTHARTPGRTLFILGANLVAMVAIAPMALAADDSQADASAWDGTERAAVRLIAGGTARVDDQTIYRAGIEIRIAPGWKTYWRYPGDSGIPPRFDFSASRNVKAVTVRWPAPQRLTDETGTSIGYKHDIVFPLEVTPQDAAQPVSLALGIDYAVCEKICVPADGKAELALTGKPGAHDGKLASSEALVPKTSALGGDSVLSVRTAKREGSRVVVDVAAPSGAVDLFAEGPAPDWALPVPAPVAGAPAGQQRFAFELDGLPPGATAGGATLTLTAVAGGEAIEVAFRLD